MPTFTISDEELYLLQSCLAMARDAVLNAGDLYRLGLTADQTTAVKDYRVETGKNISRLQLTFTP